MAAYEIPVTPGNQSFSIDLGGVTYRMALTWRAAKEAGWVLDIFDADGVALVFGIPLITGADLLGQYKHLGIGGGGALYVTTDGDPDAPPTYTNIGQTSHLLWVPA